MGKTQKFREDLLLGAVVSYADINKGVIKASPLADWARKNIPGLEDVEYYHFLRKIKTRDKKGKIVEIDKPCKLKIDEINTGRQMSTKAKVNLILNGSQPEDFLDLPKTAQKRIILDAREIHASVQAKNVNYKKENERLKDKNAELIRKQESIQEEIKENNKKVDNLMRNLTALLKDKNLQDRKRALQEMGVSDGDIDIDVYIGSLYLDEEFDIEKSISDYETSMKQAVLKDIFG